MQADDPPFLPVGTDVSAKYKGAFCEAKIKKVVRNIKCKVSLKGTGLGSITVTDEAIKGTLRVGNIVEVKLDQKKEMTEGIITKIQDCSQYTVVFDDGDITTLRRSALCLKSGRHFAESETLDQLPLTHPEHFGNPVIGSSGRRGRRTNRAQSDDSDSETCDTSGGSVGMGGPSGVTEREPHTGRVVLVQCSTADKKRAHHSHQWFPGLVVAPNAQDTVKIRVKDDYLVRSFKDSRYYTVPKKEARDFKRNNTNTEWSGMEAAIAFLDKGVLPPHWDKATLFGQDPQLNSDDGDSDDSSDDEPREEKDHFVAQLYKFMDDRGTPLNRQPTIANKDIDLYRLFNVVQKLGGYNRVTNQNQWKGIAVRLGFQPATSSVTNLCKQAYKKFLHSFEDFYRKLGVTLVAHPRGGRTTGRSLIRDRDKMHSSSSQQSASPSTMSDDKIPEPSAKTAASKAKEKEKEKEAERELREKEAKEKELREKEADALEKEMKLAKEKELKEKEREAKEKEVKEREAKEREAKEKERELKEKEAREKELRDKEAKEAKEKELKAIEKEKEAKLKAKELKEAKEKELKEKEAKEREKEQKEKEAKEKLEKKEKEAAKTKKEIKSKPVVVNSSDEEDSGDNQPLVPVSSKLDKNEPNIVEKSVEKLKSGETTTKGGKLFKSASGTIDGKKGERVTTKKIAHRRNSLPRCNAPPGKSDSATPIKTEDRCKSSSSDSSMTNKKQDSDKVKKKEDEKDKESVGSLVTVKKASSLSDKNDSDSSSRGSKNGKTSSKRNAPNDSTPPSTPGSAAPQIPSTKKPRKRKITEPSDPAPTQIVKADIGDKLKVYYGPTHSESKVTYEAKVIEIGSEGPETILKVHYTGWNTRYDEWIKPTRIADNLSLHSKGKHKDKGRRNPPNAGTGPPCSPGGKKTRTSTLLSLNTPTSSNAPNVPPNKPHPHTRNRSGSNQNMASAHPPTDVSVQSDSDSECESDSSGQRPPKRLLEEIKPIKEKLSPSDPGVTPLDSIIETEKEKLIKISRINRSPQIKRSLEGSHGRIKRTRLKQEDSDTPRGRDFDLNEIRSELKGLEKTVKSPAAESIKLEQETHVVKDESNVVIKLEKTPEKVPDDIYEFKEPEPFEFEARKSEEKKKRLPTHRIFNELPHLKLSPTSSPDKSPVRREPSPPKSHFDSAFDELCHSENYQHAEEGERSVEKENRALCLFGDMAAEDSGDRLLISEAEDSQEPLFIFNQQDIFPEKPFIPIFKGFTPAKNQETYSKKDANSKLRDTEDEFTNSPLKGEQSSDEDPIHAAIERVNAHPMSDDSNDGDLLIKTPATPTPPTGGLLSVFSTDPVDSDMLPQMMAKDDEPQCSEELPLSKMKMEVVTAKPKLDLPLDPIPTKDDTTVEIAKKKDVKQEIQIEKSSAMVVDDAESNLESKSESEAATPFADVILPEPPAGFLIHKEGPSIADKVLRAISSAKRAATPPSAKEILKKGCDLAKIPAVSSPKRQPSKGILSGETSDIKSSVSSLDSLSIAQRTGSAEALLQMSQKIELSKSSSKVETMKTDTFQMLNISDTVSSVNVLSSEADAIVISAKKETVERRKSGAEPALAAKSNKVLSETIQKLSSQISQPAPAIPMAEYQTDDRSDTTDSDDSDRRLIIDKLSEEESQSGVSLSESSAKGQVDTSQHDTAPDSSASVSVSLAKQPEEDSNISLLLCEETIPGSPAPENLGEGGKSSSSKPRSTRNLEIPFASAPSISPDQASKEPMSLKDLPREPSRECRDVSGLRNNERDCMGGNNTADTVLDNTPPITPDSSLDNMSPNRDQQLSDGDIPSDSKMNEDDNRTSGSSKKINEVEKSNSGVNMNLRSGGESPVGMSSGMVIGMPRRGRRPRSCRVSESEDLSSLSVPTLLYSSSHPPLKYNFYVDLDPGLDGASRIALLTSRLSELRKAYHNVKAELATIDRRRKKLRRKEREESLDPAMESVNQEFYSSRTWGHV